MPKFYGIIGFATQVEDPPDSGIWKDQLTKREYYGEILKNSRRLQTTDQVNDNINVDNKISIIADPYAYQNFHSMRYAEFMGARWKISNVEVEYPRLILTLGGVYNGKK